MSSAYIPVPIDTEPVDLAGESFDYLQSRIPGWLPSEGNLEVWLIEALALLCGELRRLAALVPQSIFEFYGSSILGLPPYPAIAATALTTWEAVDDRGYVVPAGTVIAIRPPGSSVGYAFQVVEQFTIAAGATIVAGVACSALQAGAGASGLSGDVQVIDALTFIKGVTLDETTAGGQDAETVERYLDRLSALLVLLSPRLILPRDYAIYAERMIPGVGRATAIDLYDADTGQEGVPRCVTVVVCDRDGEKVPAPLLAEVKATLEAMREVNFRVFAIDPTYTTVDVNADVRVWPSYDPEEVAGRAAATLENWLSPGAWGVPKFGDPGSVQSWLNDDTVRYLTVAEQLLSVDGVWFVDQLQIGSIDGGTMGQNDVVLAGVGPLPRPGEIIVDAHR